MKIKIKDLEEMGFVDKLDNTEDTIFLVKKINEQTFLEYIFEKRNREKFFEDTLYLGADLHPFDFKGNAENCLELKLKISDWILDIDLKQFKDATELKAFIGCLKSEELH